MTLELVRSLDRADCVGSADPSEISCSWCGRHPTPGEIFPRDEDGDLSCRGCNDLAEEDRLSCSWCGRESSKGVGMVQDEAGDPICKKCKRLDGPMTVASREDLVRPRKRKTKLHSVSGGVSKDLPTASSLESQ